jgi:hypothetical protein
VLSSEIVVFSGKKFFGIFVNPYLSRFHQNMSGRSTFFAALAPGCLGYESVWPFGFW